jgi:hypothetical protein
MPTKDGNNTLEQARALVRENLRQCCEEVLQWHDTTILPDGRVREVTNLLEPVMGANALGVAENLVTRAALEEVTAKSSRGASGETAQAATDDCLQEGKSC